MKAQSASWNPSWKYRKSGEGRLPWPMAQMEEFQASWAPIKEERPRPLTPEQTLFIDGFTPRLSRSSSSLLVGDRRGEGVGIMMHGRGGVSVEPLHNGAVTARGPSRSFGGGELHVSSRPTSTAAEPPNPSGYYAIPPPPAGGVVSHESFRSTRIFEPPERRRTPFDPQGRSSSLSLSTSLSLRSPNHSSNHPPNCSCDRCSWERGRTQRPLTSGWATCRGYSKGGVQYWA